VVALTVKVIVFSDVTLSGSFLRFRGNCSLQLQGFAVRNGGISFYQLQRHYVNSKSHALQNALKKYGKIL
jgi:hypothetical protein